MSTQSKLASAFWALKVGLGASTFVAGADKFFNVLTEWEKYLAPAASRKLPVSDRNYMRLVGVIEMVVGAGILTNRTRLASYAASAWLLGIAADLVMNGDYDIAVRDVNMAIGAFALAQLSEARTQESAEEELVERRLRAA